LSVPLALCLLCLLARRAALRLRLLDGSGGLGVLRDLDGDVTRPLEDAGGAAARTRAEPLERRALVDEHGVDDEVVAVPVQRGIRLRVRDRRAQHLLDVDRSSTLGERQD